ncbi:CaiB/BaiF CoA transferase family protein [Nocardioides lianchengensis]|uniref:Formyl-CoA transferase n=1 Tax=Nocardioides lianchengensis TaxID=1045774 RepID=A0A1G6ZX03_9ACTN|nr:CoA transferase [Nocardioides lianchengensis]NYG12269.1 formyl-CoA transferase [Nocardioides lianchengensis]SDE07204.1 formyl-CoA transferase [Nocardioides lianchengensis]
MNAQTPGPLADVLVVEVGSFIAAPYAATQLADLGARVVKVETPGTGDFVRGNAPFVGGESSSFVRLNRNKESVELDLKSEAGRDAFRALVRRADVLVENLRPGAMRRMGLGYADLAPENPRLVYASASGWGQDGPLADRPGLDIMAQARSGLMSVTGFPDAGPAKVGVPICDLMCAMYVALGVTAALRERDRSGRGQHLDVSLYESGVSLGVWEAGRYFGDGTVPGPQGSAHQSQAPYQAVVTADGHVTVGANTPGLWLRFCAALGLDALPEDPRFADNAGRMTHRDALVTAIEAVTATLPTDRVVEILDEAGVPCAPIQTYDQVFADPALAARDFFWDAEHPTLGPVRQIGSPMRFSRTPVRRDGAGPLLGDSTDAVLAELEEAR